MTTGKIVNYREVTDETGNHRLVLKRIERPWPGLAPEVFEPFTNGDGFGHQILDWPKDPPNVVKLLVDHHSLVWETWQGATWIEKVTITQEDFVRDVQHDRYIGEIHSFDPSTGHAIIEVYEEQPFIIQDGACYAGSWRIWDLLANKEVRRADFLSDLQ